MGDVLHPGEPHARAGCPNLLLSQNKPLNAGELATSQKENGWFLRSCFLLATTGYLSGWHTCIEQLLMSCKRLDVITCELVRLDHSSFPLPGEVFEPSHLMPGICWYHVMGYILYPLCISDLILYQHWLSYSQRGVSRAVWSPIPSAWGFPVPALPRGKR